MADRTVRCHGCGTSSVFEDVVPRGAVCDSCAASLKCCLNCRHHDPSVYNECHETSAERVVEKDSSNFCDYFDPASASPRPGGEGSGALSELDKLFGKK